MADQWYLSRGGNEYGPYSTEHVLKLKELGRLQPTDLVRKEGMDEGVLAGEVKQLFPEATADVAVEGMDLAPTSAAETQTGVLAPSSPEAAVETVASPGTPTAGVEKPPPAPTPPSRPKEVKRKRRAVAISGAILMGQDGTTVLYRKKCGRCGHEDQVRSSMIIGIGICRATYFCPKCRKPTQIQIQGIT
jgi:hypothetical protein